MIRCELLENILDQPRSVEAVSKYQLGEGRAALLDAARRTLVASRIILSGMGSSLFACWPLSYYLAARGVPATIIEASELLHYQSEMCRPGTVVILLSRSGETVEIAKLLPILKDKRVPVIGVTNVPDSLLARESPRPILVHSFPDQLVAVQTYTGTVITLLLLGAALCGELDAKWENDLAALVRALSNFIPDCVEASEDWRTFLEPAGVVYLLGRGPSLGSVSEGALLFHEAAKMPAVGMPAAHFRHGPVEVVTEEFRAVLFATNRPTRELDLALAADIRGMGGCVRVIGETGWPANLPEALAPVAEIVPVQVAALRLAEWRGITPGDFRFAPAVTRSETGFDAIARPKIRP